MNAHQKMMFAVKVMWSVIIAAAVLVLCGLVATVLSSEMALGLRVIAALLLCIVAIEVVTTLTDRDA